MTQRLTIVGTARRGHQAETVALWLAEQVTEEGGLVLSARGVAKKRGGGVQVVAEAADAMAVMRAVRARVDADVSAFALDALNELRMGAYRDSSGGMLGFVTEDYAVVREFA